MVTVTTAARYDNWDLLLWSSPIGLVLVPICSHPRSLSSAALRRDEGFSPLRGAGASDRQRVRTWHRGCLRAAERRKPSVTPQSGGREHDEWVNSGLLLPFHD